MKDKIFSISKYLFMIICTLVALFPLAWVITSSFKTNAEILSNGLSLPSSFAFTGYQIAIQISPIIQFFFNSIVIASFSTAINVLILSMSAYVFARFNFKFKNSLYTLLSLSLVIPTTALLQPVYTIITGLGLDNTRTGLIVVYTAINMAMSMLILRATFYSIPKSLDEAAYIDGAGFCRTFFQIVLPCAKGGLTSAGVLSFLNSWNEFTFALLLTKSTDVRTLPLSLGYFTAQFSFNYTAMFAAITMSIVPSIVVFIIFQEQVVSSLTTGSVKE